MSDWKAEPSRLEPRDFIAVDGLAQVSRVDRRTGLWSASGQMGSIELVTDLGGWLTAQAQEQRCWNCGAPREHS